MTSTRSLESMKEELLALLLQEEDDAPPPESIALADRRGLLSLSYSQQRVWFIDRFTGGGAAYNIPRAFEVQGRLDRAALERTLNEIVRRHEVLRTIFDMADGAPVQVIAPELRLAMPVTDISGLPPDERQARAKWLAQEEAQAPFDLQTGPLLRARLIVLGEDAYVFLLTFHHIVFDAWSMGVLVGEVAALYSAFVEGTVPLLPELALQYADFAHWQRQRLAGEVLQQQLDYWKTQLQGAPALLSLPTDRPRPAVQTHEGGMVPVVIPAHVAKGLHRISQQAQATLFMALAAAFNVLLSRYAGQDDICIGTPIANRQRAELEPLVGFFANTLALRTRVDAAQCFDELLAQVKAATLGAYTHQDLPFEQVVEHLAPERNTSHSPLVQVMFVLQNAPMGKLELPGLALRPMDIEHNVSPLDLTLTLVEAEDGLRGHVEYNTDLFDRATAERMAAHFGRLLAALVANPRAPLRELDMLAGGERQQLLVEWNSTAHAHAHEHAQTLHGLFEQQALHCPETEAVKFAGQSLTYRELNARANRLAHYLRGQGVGADSLVGVCVERSVEMVVGLLGILKAGGAY
ncbi:condensation domain-containing protein, partial [Janthinobacterium sp. SUN120]|uniref:condensation domain-containing protein n=1 Tax=Janthinobacterium sp. SUN120 TaxID=3004099 RepID=UPI0025AFEC7B